MFSGGYALKLLRIDLSAKSYRVEDIPEMDAAADIRRLNRVMEGNNGL